MTYWSKSEKETRYCNKHLITSPPLCKFCNLGLKYIGNGSGYRSYCDIKCRNLDNGNRVNYSKVVETSKKTCIEKYGVDNFRKSEEFNVMRKGWEEKRITALQNSLTEKYGGPSPFFSKEILEKKNETMLDRYGEVSFFNTTSYKDNMSLRPNEEKRKGYEGCIKTLRMKHSDETITSPWSLDYVQNKMRSTRLRKYGTEWPMKNYDSFIKNKESCFKLKQYTDKFGNVHKLQGYEPQVFKILEEEFGVELVSDCSLIPDIILETGSRYYPDLIDINNKIVYEVKSEYTFSVATEKLKLCKEAVENLGFEYRIAVYAYGKIFWK